MNDLRSDSRSKWIPNGPMWFTYLKIDAPASTITHDLAIDASGFGHPDPIAAGFPPASMPVPDPNAARSLLWLGAGLALVALFARRRIQQAARHDEARGGGRGGVCNVAGCRGACGRRDRHPGPRADGDDDDPLLALRPGFPAGRAGRDGPVRGDEHRPDRPRVPGGRRRDAGDPREGDRGPSRRPARRDLGAGGRDRRDDVHLSRRRSRPGGSSRATCRGTTTSGCTDRSRSAEPGRS